MSEVNKGFDLIDSTYERLKESIIKGFNPSPNIDQLLILIVKAHYANSGKILDLEDLLINISKIRQLAQYSEPPESSSCEP